MALLVVIDSHCKMRRGQSQYRGVTRHHQQGRWEARIGRVNGNKYIYLGTFTSEKEAAKAYDAAAIQYRGKKVLSKACTAAHISCLACAPCACRH